MEKIGRAHKPGYIILLTLLVVAAIVALLTAVVQQSFSYQQQARVSIEKARARMLALSALEIAMSQLSTVIIEEEKQSKDNTKDTSKNKAQAMLEPVQKWLLKVLPLINHWQKISVQEEGLEGTIELYLACEEGKFNLAAFKPESRSEKEVVQKTVQQDTQKNEGQQQGQVAKNEQKGLTEEKNQEKGALEALDELFKKVYDVSMHEAFKRFMQDFKRLPEDPTELLRITYFAKLKDRLFTPRTQDQRGLFIMDLFTFRPLATEKVNPWLLTASAKKLLGLQEKNGTVDVNELVKKIKPEMQWETDWDEIFAPLYGKNFAGFDPALQKVFATAFEATSFSMVSYCTVGSITQRIYAVLEVTEPDKELSPKSVIFKVKKLYWL
jgi:type II secretory pathway pseudopilin PulG